MNDTLDIGRRNINSAHKTLKKEKIKLKSEAVGGTSGRTINFDLKTGKIQIKTSGKKTKVI
jgi:chemotaxis protein CheD